MTMVVYEADRTYGAFVTGGDRSLLYLQKGGEGALTFRGKYHSTEEFSDLLVQAKENLITVFPGVGRAGNVTVVSVITFDGVGRCNLISGVNPAFEADAAAFFRRKNGADTFFFAAGTGGMREVFLASENTDEYFYREVQPLEKGLRTEEICFGEDVPECEYFLPARAGLEKT